MRSVRRVLPPALLSLIAAASIAPSEARADDELSVDFRGSIETNLRFRLEDKAVGTYYNRLEAPRGVERNQNTLSLNLHASYGQFSGVADIDFVLDGYSGGLNGVESLSRIEDIQPYRFEPQALYFQATGLFTEGLDLRIGHQLVLWGVGDQFNPTNNLNSDDLRDVVLFGRQQPNFMVKADYWLTDELSFSGVLVPIFRPAATPDTGALALASIDRLPFTDETLRHRIEAETAASESDFVKHPTVVSKVIPVLPQPSFDNMQSSFRIAGTLAEQDIALSYYNGRTDFPVPFLNHTRQSVGVRCDPENPTKCADGLLETDVYLHFPRMHVYGLNVAGEMNPLGWIDDAINALGYRVELALIVPRRATIKVEQEALALALPQPAGEYDYDGDGTPGGPLPTVVEDVPFLKWTVGLDYTFGEHVYANVQWVHGLPDEYGAGDFFHEGYSVRKSGVTTSPNDTVFKCALSKNGEECAREILRPRIADYLALGVDLKFMNDAALLRFFTLWDLDGYEIDTWDVDSEKRIRRHFSLFTQEGFSAVLYPEFSYNFSNGLELAVGALVQLGQDYTKFGDPAGGGSLAWTRGKFSF